MVATILVVLRTAVRLRTAEAANHNITTTSARLNEYTKTMAEKFGTRLFIGKGGMDAASGKVFTKLGCAYLAFTGGAGALAASGIKEVVEVHFEDLGMAEAVWQLRVEDFGPLVVAMDARGGSLYDR